MKFNCLPLLVTLLVLVQLTGATSAKEKVESAWIKEATPQLAWIGGDTAENVLYLGGYEDESKYISLVSDFINEARAVFSASLPGAVAGHISDMLMPLTWKWIKEILTDYDIMSFIKQKVEELKKIREKVPEGKQQEKEAEQNYLDWVLRFLEDLKIVILKNNPHLKAKLKLRAKSLGRSSVQILTKYIVRYGFKGSLKSAAMPVGAVADIAQAGLECAGYEEAGKKVGIVGNIGSGAMFGFALGGPAGAVVGAGGGTVLWLGGEAVGYVFETVTDEEIN